MVSTLARAALAGLWWDAKGDWTRAHESAQQDEGFSGAWVHAYLHRKEGDDSNAEYWYRRASKTPSRASLEREWTEIAESLLRASLLREGAPHALAMPHLACGKSTGFRRYRNSMRSRPICVV
jgi:hypothetical protein